MIRVGSSPRPQRRLSQHMAQKPTFPRKNSTQRPMPPPPPGRGYHRKLSTHMGDIKAKFTFDFQHATAHPLKEIDWSQAVGFTSSAEGSEGVFFVQFKDGSAVVVKGSSTIAADMYAQELAHHARIPIPSFCVMRYKQDADFVTIFQTLNRLDSQNALGMRGRHQKSLDRPVFEVMEYVAGKDLLHVAREDVFGKTSAMSRKGKDVMREVGRFNSMDVLMNNWDRLPLIWDNEGNAGNIMFVTDKHRHLHPIAIDNSLTCIDSSLEENFAEYMDKVRCILNEIAAFFNYEKKPLFEGVRDSFPITCFEKAPSVNNIREFIKRNEGYDIGDEGLRAFMLGFMEGAMTYATLSRSDLEHIKTLIEEEIGACLQNAKMTVDSVGMNKVHVDFLDAVCQIYRDAMPMMSKVIAMERSQTSGEGKS